MIEGRPNIIDFIKNGEIQLVINTTFGENEIKQSYSIRRESLVSNIPYFTTVSGAQAAVEAIDALKNEGLDVKPIQDYYIESNLNLKSLLN